MEIHKPGNLSLAVVVFSPRKQMLHTSFPLYPRIASTLKKRWAPDPFMNGSTTGWCKEDATTEYSKKLFNFKVLCSHNVDVFETEILWNCAFLKNLTSFSCTKEIPNQRWKYFNELSKVGDLQFWMALLYRRQPTACLTLKLVQQVQNFWNAMFSFHAQNDFNPFAEELFCNLFQACCQNCAFHNSWCRKTAFLSSA